MAVTVVIIMGLVAFTMLSTISENMSDSLYSYYESQAFADLHLEFSWTDVATVDEILRVEGVRGAEGRAVVQTRAPLAEDHEPTLRLIGTPPGSSVNIPYLVEGRMPSGDLEIALLHSFARANDIGPGDEIPVVLSGRETSFTVVGLAMSPEFTYAIEDIRSMLPDDRGFGVGFVALSDLQERVGGYGRMNSATVLLEPSADPDDVADAIEDRVTGWGLRSVITRDDHISHTMVEMELDGLEQVSQMIPVAFLGIAAVVIYMMLSRMIQDDRASIGILKATGYTDGEILFHYFKYALVMGIIGAVIGLASGQLLSIPFSAFFVEFFHIPDIRATVDPLYHLIGFTVTVAFCGATGLLAARGTLGVAPAEALRPPAPPPGSKNMIEILAPASWDAIPFAWRTALRYIFRGKRRFFLGMMGVALTFTVVLLPVYAYSAMMGIFVDQFQELDVYDFTVSFDAPVTLAGARDILRDVRVEEVEPFMEYPVSIEWGWREQGMVAKALPAGAALQRFEDLNGSERTVPERGIFISEYVADRLGVAAGDFVEVSSPMVRDRTVQMPVRAVVVQYLGSGVYMSIDQMRALVGGGAGYDGVLLNSGDDVSTILSGTRGVASVQSTQELVDRFMDYLGFFIFALGFYSVVGGVLGFAILFNTVSASVSERRREIASLRVLGYSKAEVFGLLVRENLLAIIMGLVVGLPMGYSMVALIVHYFSTELFSLPLKISPEAVAFAAAMTVGFSTITMLAVRVRVRRMGFLEALTSRLS